MLLLLLHNSGFTSTFLIQHHMCFAEYGMSLAWVFYRAAVKYGQEKGKIIRGLIHSTLPCLSAVTKVVYYHYHQCMIINMYKGISPSSKAPTGHDRPKTNYVSAPSRENIRQRCTSPWHRPSTAESAREVEWVFVFSQTSTRSALAPFSFFVLYDLFTTKPTDPFLFRTAVFTAREALLL